MMNRFWWDHKRDRAKGIHWLSWDKLSMPKSEGGMGFKNISAFNLAMLSKQAWRLTTIPDSLVSRLYKARYFPNCDYLNSNIGHNHSHVWRSIWSSKFVIKGGLKWSIGSEENILIWDPFWMFDGTSLTNPWPNNLVVDNLKVSDLMSPNGKHWNQSVIHSLVGDEAAEKIQNTLLFTAVQNDNLVWKHESNGKFSAQSAYRYLINDAIDTSHLRIRMVKRTIIISFFSVLKVLSVGYKWVYGLCCSRYPVKTNKRLSQLFYGVSGKEEITLFGIRDDTSQFIVARIDWFSPCTDVAIGEALGLLKTLNWVHELGFDNMDFELDAKRVVDSVTNLKLNDSDFGAITGKCNRLMALFFRNSHVEFVRRQANEVTHALTRVAPSFANFRNLIFQHIFRILLLMK
ncbi:uncharacterized protein LOC131627507 [Vicia villosa]|uniref:uncharacterized protein LOC131627507 n=1 Tax=Vicia villosa TaxID=3911 RepID=UPI00273C1A11|nr:uncharacterized protein LOC131627507 [Vicia villosa]